MPKKKDFRLEGVGVVLEDLDIYTDHICVVRHRKGDWLVCVVGFSICREREREQGVAERKRFLLSGKQNYGKRD